MAAADGGAAWKAGRGLQDGSPPDKDEKKESAFGQSELLLGAFPALGFPLQGVFLVMQAPASQGHNLFVKPVA